VYRENIGWRVQAATDEALGLLPLMQTDVCVESKDKKTIIEVKYYSDTLGEHHGARKFHSENLYQLYSYLGNSRREDFRLEGLLLYPRVDRDIDAHFELDGLPVRVKTLDLATPWEE